MSRSGYSEDCENLELYRKSVENALKGARGQAFLKELATLMDAMPEKILIANEVISETGQCCTAGVVCKARGLDVSHIELDYGDGEDLAKLLGIARCMAAEIAFMNDEWGSASETPAERWVRMRKWVAENITP